MNYIIKALNFLTEKWVNLPVPVKLLTIILYVVGLFTLLF